MSQHPSLKSKGREKAHRSVWKRHERLKFLSEKEKWSETDSVYGLEKIKLLKVKIKKDKVAAAADGAEGAAGAPAAPPQAGKGETQVKSAAVTAKPEKPQKK